MAAIAILNYAKNELGVDAVLIFRGKIMGPGGNEEEHPQR
jgi:hypothetical protein